LKFGELKFGEMKSYQSNKSSSELTAWTTMMVTVRSALLSHPLFVYVVRTNDRTHLDIFRFVFLEWDSTI